MRVEDFMTPNPQALPTAPPKLLTATAADYPLWYAVC